MKKLIFLTITVLYFLPAISQQNLIDSVSASWANLEYTVPESPAYFLLKTNPDNILEPSSTKNLAFTIADYYLKNGMVIPKNFGLELSPMLFVKKISISDFKSHPFFYRTKFSLGTNTLENNCYQVAEGLRFTLVDKRDLRTNITFIDVIEKFSINRTKIKSLVLDSFQKANNLTYKKIIDLDEAYMSDTVLRNLLDGIIESKCEMLFLGRNQLQKFRDDFAKNNWNTKVWEIGIAVLEESKDSLFRNLQLSKLGFWTAYSGRFTEKDQFLAGGSYMLTDSINEWKPQLGIALRYYRGSNAWRGFVQIEFKNFDKSNQITGSLGLLTEITEGNWGQFTFSLSYDFKGNISYSPGIRIGISPKSKSFDKIYL